MRPLNGPEPRVGVIGVRVALFADLRRFAPPGHRTETLELPAGATVRDVLSAFSIPDDLQVTVGLNGELGTIDSALRDGDDLVLMNPMEGG